MTSRVLVWLNLFVILSLVVSLAPRPAPACMRPAPMAQSSWPSCAIKRGMRRGSPPAARPPSAALQASARMLQYNCSFTMPDITLRQAHTCPAKRSGAGGAGDAALGRFVQADTIVPNPADPQALNRYSYVNNRPLLYADPTGHCGELSIECPKERERDISSAPGWAKSLAVAGCSMFGECRVREKADGSTVIRSGGCELFAEGLESSVVGLANPIAGPVVGLVDDVGTGLLGKAGGAIKNVVGKLASKLGIGRAGGSELAHSLSNLGDMVAMQFRLDSVSLYWMLSKKQRASMSVQGNSRKA